ncbi:MAG TPA: L-lactate dehydrogenase [Candidatus Aphodovivens avistercoris]|nr:L-lactate dehydrogenase [Candidatus Aphodovivens avistercoris]
MPLISQRKAAIIGCGFVGSSTVFTLMQSGLFSEMVLIDVDQDRAEGEALDIAHGMPFASPMSIHAGSYADAVDADIAIITAGAAQKPGETRLDLVHKNVGIFKSIIPQLVEAGFDGIMLVVSNPVDILTYVALKLSGLPASRVIGSGTVLDSARFKYILGQHLGVDPRNVHARIIGEHGDSEIAIWSTANVSGIPVNDFCELRGHFDHDESMRRIAADVKNSAYEIIKKKKATYYGIAMSVKRICEAIMRDEKPILTVSSYQDGPYGLHDVVLSMPCVVGRAGVEYQVPHPLDEHETTRLHESARTLREIIDQLEL